MSREIKFRFFIEAVEKMTSWDVVKKECDRLSLFSLEGWIPMQYTGLKDKNGVEIYEGDIVNLGNPVFVSASATFVNDHYQIIWCDEGYFGFMEIPAEPGNPSQCDKEGWAMFEVIGNVHENPELLK